MRFRVTCGFALLTLGLTLGILTGCSKQAARSDAQITTEVQAKLYSDSNVQSRQIGVQAANGVVTLTGNVTSESERTAAQGDFSALDDGNGAGVARLAEVKADEVNGG